MNTKIREQNLQNAPQQTKTLWESIKVIRSLHKKYGDKVKEQELNNAIKTASNTTHSMLSLLIQTNNYNTQSINTLFSLIKRYKESFDDTTQVKITQNIETQKLKDLYQNIETQETQTVGFSIAQKGKIYKRELDTDINKLLNQ